MFFCRYVFRDVPSIGRQAVWRKMQQLGCSQLYRRGEDTHQVLKELLSLPYLPADQIVPVFAELRRRNDVQRLDEVMC